MHGAWLRHEPGVQGRFPLYHQENEIGQAKPSGRFFRDLGASSLHLLSGRSALASHRKHHTLKELLDRIRLTGDVHPTEL